MVRIRDGIREKLSACMQGEGLATREGFESAMRLRAFDLVLPDGGIA